MVSSCMNAILRFISSHLSAIVLSCSDVFLSKRFYCFESAVCKHKLKPWAILSHVSSSERSFCRSFTSPEISCWSDAALQPLTGWWERSFIKVWFRRDIRDCEAYHEDKSAVFILPAGINGFIMVDLDDI